MWLSKLYQRSERDAVLLNIRNDFAELIMVDPFTGYSKYVTLNGTFKTNQPES